MMEKSNTRSSALYIDPKNCGSMVAYRIWIDEWTHKDKPTEYSVNACVTLSDCNRKIDWDFSGEDEQLRLQKIDNAIEMLREFRRELIAVQKIANKLGGK